MRRDTTAGPSGPIPFPIVPARAPGGRAALYLYGVAHAGSDFDLGFAPVSAPGAAPITLKAGQLAAVATPIEVPEALSTKRNLLTHAEALETLAQRADILPARFGLIMDGPAEVGGFLAANQSVLLAALDGVDGCVEFNLTVAVAQSRALRDLAAERPELLDESRAAAARSAGEAHFQRVALGRRIAGALDQRRAAERKALLDRITPFTRRLICADAAKPDTLLEADLLIERARVDALIDLLETIAEESGDRLEIELAGPGPAYRFAALTLSAPELVGDGAAPSALAG